MPLSLNYQVRELNLSRLFRNVPYFNLLEMSSNGSMSMLSPPFVKIVD